MGKEEDRQFKIESRKRGAPIFNRCEVFLKVPAVSDGKIFCGEQDRDKYFKNAA